MNKTEGAEDQAPTSPLDRAKSELAAAGPEIHAGDSHAALWRFYDCLMNLVEHLETKR